MSKCCVGMILGVLGAACLAVAAAPAQTANSGYHLLKKYQIGGEGFWDYLKMDSEARRLYISRGSHVVVLNADTGEVAGDIPNTDGVHGIALAPELGRGFTSNGRTATVTIFDMKTLKVIGEAKTDAGPDGIIYDPASRRVFTFNGRGSSTTAIDAATGNVAGTIPLDGRPEFAAADGAGHVYNNLEDKSIVVQIDSKSLKVLNRWPLAPCESPSGMAIDREHRRLFIGCHNQMMAVMDADTGKVIATPAIGRGVDANRFDPGTGFAFSSNGEGTLTVVHEDSPDKFTVVDNVQTQVGARTMALDLKTHNVYLVTAEFGPAAAATAENPRPRRILAPQFLCRPGFREITKPRGTTASLPLVKSSGIMGLTYPQALRSAIQAACQELTAWRSGLGKGQWVSLM